MVINEEKREREAKREEKEAQVAAWVDLAWGELNLGVSSETESRDKWRRSPKARLWAGCFGTSSLCRLPPTRRLAMPR